MDQGECSLHCFSFRTTHSIHCFEKRSKSRAPSPRHRRSSRVFPSPVAPTSWSASAALRDPRIGPLPAGPVILASGYAASRSASQPSPTAARRSARPRPHLKPPAIACGIAREARAQCKMARGSSDDALAIPKRPQRSHRRRNCPFDSCVRSGLRVVRHRRHRNPNALCFSLGCLRLDCNMPRGDSEWAKSGEGVS